MAHFLKKVKNSLIWMVPNQCLRERDGKTYLKGVEFSNGIKEATVVDGKWSCRNRATKLVTQI